VIDRPVNPT